MVELRAALAGVLYPRRGGGSQCDPVVRRRRRSPVGHRLGVRNPSQDFCTHILASVVERHKHHLFRSINWRRYRHADPSPARWCSINSAPSPWKSGYSGDGAGQSRRGAGGGDHDRQHLGGGRCSRRYFDIDISIQAGTKYLIGHSELHARHRRRQRALLGSAARLPLS